MPGAWGSVDASARGRVSTWMCGQVGASARWRMMRWRVGPLAHRHVHAFTRLRISTLTRWRVGASARWRIGSLAHRRIGTLMRWHVDALAHRHVGEWAGKWAGCIENNVLTLYNCTRIVYLMLILDLSCPAHKAYLVLSLPFVRTDVYKISFYLISNHRLSLIS